MTVRVFDATTEEWGDINPVNFPNPNWPTAGVNDGGAGSAGDAKFNNDPATGTSTMAFTNPPTHTTDNNGWAYETTDNMTKVKVTAKWKSTGRPASADNTIVENERHQLTFTMETSTG